MKIEFSGNEMYTNLINNSSNIAEKITTNMKRNPEDFADTAEISPESKALASNEILNNLHVGLTLERVKFLLTPRV
jgi:hypothetical protein